jgi:hypothetical protein
VNDDKDRFWLVLRLIPNRATPIAAVVIHDGISADALKNAGAWRPAQRAGSMVEDHKNSRKATASSRARATRTTTSAFEQIKRTHTARKTHEYFRKHLGSLPRCRVAQWHPDLIRGAATPGRRIVTRDAVEPSRARTRMTSRALHICVFKTSSTSDSRLEFIRTGAKFYCLLA